VYVEQKTSRIASTGREMKSVSIVIDIEGGGKLILPTLWAELPYVLPRPVLGRIKDLVAEMIFANIPLKEIREELAIRYYSGFPKEQNISDMERYRIGKKRRVLYFYLRGRQVEKYRILRMQYEKRNIEMPIELKLQVVSNGGFVTYHNGNKYVSERAGSVNMLPKKRIVKK
jgi:hypothetical protein